MHAHPRAQFQLKNYACNTCSINYCWRLVELVMKCTWRFPLPGISWVPCKIDQKLKDGPRLNLPALEIYLTELVDKVWLSLFSILTLKLDSMSAYAFSDILPFSAEEINLHRSNSKNSQHFNGYTELVTSLICSQLAKSLAVMQAQILVFFTRDNCSYAVWKCTSFGK